MSDDISHSRVAQANEEYEAEKRQRACYQVSVARIERRLKLQPGQLAHWRANQLSRKGLLRRNGPQPGSLLTTAPAPEATR